MTPQKPRNPKADGRVDKETEKDLMQNRKCDGQNLIAGYQGPRVEEVSS